MRAYEICNMDVITQTGAVPSLIIAAIDLNIGSFTECSLNCDLDKMCRIRGGLAGSPRRIGSSHVEV
jgi:hypothetical protein